MRFEFATASRILFGAGTLREAGPVVGSFGRRALVVTGRGLSRAGRLLAELRGQGVEVVTFANAGEPTTETIRHGTDRARQEHCDVIVGFGGGSAIDAAKAIAALLANGGELTDYLEVVGGAKPLTRAAAPCVAIPTTAGAGAEVTRNAVLASPEHRVKVSLRSPWVLPRVALVDPELTYDLPPDLTARTGLDALTQLVEPYVCNRANPLVDALCVEGMRRVARSLRQACEHRHDPAAREDMALASLFGGLALANAGLGAVHGFASPIGGMFGAPHGAVCAALLPSVMSVNVRALRLREADREPLRRYDEVARILTGRAHASPEEGIDWVEQLRTALAIPGLRAYGLTRESVAGVAARAAEASSMKANPVALTRGELEEVLVSAL
jgi:alcohol dehydrogenase class IV